MKKSRLNLGSWLVGLLVLTPAIRVQAAQDACLSLGLPAWTNNRIQFSLRGESRVRYVIEASSDLQSWTPVATNYDASMTRVITSAAAD